MTKAFKRVGDLLPGDIWLEPFRAGVARRARRLRCVYTFPSRRYPSDVTITAENVATGEHEFMVLYRGDARETANGEG